MEYTNKSYELYRKICVPNIKIGKKVRLLSQLKVGLDDPIGIYNGKEIIKSTKRKEYEKLGIKIKE